MCVKVNNEVVKSKSISWMIDNWCRNNTAYTFTCFVLYSPYTLSRRNDSNKILLGFYIVVGC